MEHLPHGGVLLEKVFIAFRGVTWHWRNPHTRMTLCGQVDRGYQMPYTGKRKLEPCQRCRKYTTHESKN